MHKLLFEEIDTGEVLIISGLKVRGPKRFQGSKANKYYIPKPVKVKAGRYYLKTITPAFSNIGKRRFNKPNCDSCFFVVKSSSVVYLGRWNIDFHRYSHGKVDWDIEREYSLETLKNCRLKIQN